MPRRDLWGDPGDRKVSEVDFGDFFCQLGPPGASKGATLGSPEAHPGSPGGTSRESENARPQHQPAQSIQQLTRGNRQGLTG